jgi:hypothetical protein
MIVYIGSVAFNKYLGSDARPPKDTDLIADYHSALSFLQKKGCIEMYPTHEGKKLFGRDPDGMRYEIEIAWPDTTADELLTILARQALQFHDGGVIPPLDVLYTIKLSHRYLKDSPHFLKTRGDILAMRSMGAKIFNQDWYRKRMAETYYYEHPDLTRDKAAFFVDVYKYDHDSLHEAVAIYDRPAYTYYQREGAKGVLCSKQMFFDEVSEDIRIAGVVEEASVLALERSLVPHPGTWSEDKAFDFALMKVCTSITSGWFREFAWENYGKARRLFQRRSKKNNLLKLLDQGLKNGTVKPYANADERTS